MRHYRHNLDPLNSDSVEVKLVPLGFYPDLDENIVLYAQVKDRMGHLRSGIPLSYSKNGENQWYVYSCFSDDTDSRGLGYCGAETSLYLDTDQFYPVGDAEPSPGYNHHITVTAGSSSDELYFLSIPGTEKDPLTYVYGTHSAKCVGSDTVILGCPGSLTNRCVYARAKTAADHDIEGAEIEFSVMEPQTKPDNFQNVMLSRRATPYTPPFEYPNPWVFMGDDPKDGADKLTVYTNRYGVASACFYWGNTDNFTYQIKAKNLSAAPEDGSSVVFNLTLLQTWAHGPYPGSPPHPWKTGIQWFSNWHNIPEYALYGKETTVSTILKEFQAANEACCDGDTVNTPCETCPFKVLAPDPKPRVSWFWNVGSWPSGTPQAYTYPDDQGIAGLPVTVPTDLGTNAYYIMSSRGPYGQLQVREIKGKSVSNITVQMYRQTKSNAEVLIQDGGTVHSMDRALIVRINNRLSYYLELELKESPTIGGDMLYGVQREHYLDNNHMIVFPGEKDYYFEIPKGASPGRFDFYLRDKETREILNSKTGYISDCCESGYCPDCPGSSTWFGMSGGAGGVVLVGGGFKSYGKLYCLDQICQEVSFEQSCFYAGPAISWFKTVAGLKFEPIAASANVNFNYCAPAKCAEDLEGQSGSAYGGGGYKVFGASYQYTLGRVRCQTFSVGVGIGLLGGVATCTVNTINTTH